MSELRWVIVGSNNEIEYIGARPTPIDALNFAEEQLNSDKELMDICRDDVRINSMPNVSLLLSSSLVINQARIEAVREFAEFIINRNPRSVVSTEVGYRLEQFEQLKEQENG
jgi:hypothetical protein